MCRYQRLRLRIFRQGKVGFGDCQELGEHAGMLGVDACFDVQITPDEDARTHDSRYSDGAALDQVIGLQLWQLPSSWESDAPNEGHSQRRGHSGPWEAAK